MTALVDTNLHNRKLLSHDWMMTLFYRRPHHNKSSKMSRDEPSTPLIPIKRNQLLDPVRPESERTTGEKSARCPSITQKGSFPITFSRSFQSSRNPRSTRKVQKTPTLKVELLETVPSAHTRGISFVSADQLMDNPLRCQVPSVINVFTGPQENQENGDTISEVSLDDFVRTPEELLMYRENLQQGLETKVDQMTCTPEEDLWLDSFDENCLLNLSSSCSTSSEGKDITFDLSWLHHQTNAEWGMTTIPLEGDGEWPSDEDKSPMKRKLGHEVQVLESYEFSFDEKLEHEKPKSSITWTAHCTEGMVEIIQVTTTDQDGEASVGLPC
jgi:hypothetical protein